VRILNRAAAVAATFLAGLATADAKLVQFELEAVSSSGETAATLSFVINDEAAFIGSTGVGNLFKLFDADDAVEQLSLTVENLSSGASGSINLSDIAFRTGSLAQVANPAPFDFNQSLRLSGENSDGQQIFSTILVTDRDDPDYNPFSTSPIALLEDFDPEEFILASLSGSSTLQLNPMASAAFQTFASVLSMDSSAGPTLLTFVFNDAFATDDFGTAPVPVPAAALLFAPAVAGFALRRRKRR
jgi:hypothetical protein